MSELRGRLAGRERSVGPIIFELALIGFVLLIVMAAFEVGSRARLFPLVVGIPTLVGLTIMLARDLVGRRPADEPVHGHDAIYDPVTGEHHLPDLSNAGLGELYAAAQDEIEAEEVLPDTPEARRRQVLLAVWTLAIVVVGALFSFLLAVPLGLAAILLITRQRWYVVLATTVGVTVFIYVLFGMILGVRF